ncbi:N-acyl homoserine lactonase family protein [Lactobacillus sp. PV037]|uniref:N-acyl homoserine lactonase family protein n=1 Tax=Lactobacillus sp. PV037 TaxID=2594496 RepID=UPI00223FC799|nr:N-acyl homoserine lactonase family protein [Lactobacillus sp. PV037]QNQ83680.1 N-acyl homoserine lactonase family protein [Lactobacillus sp. PV037]
MNNYKLHLFHTGKVRIEPELAFGGDHASLAKASGFSLRRSPKIWLPVSVFLIESPHGLLLLDTGWSRSMSPNGEFDKKAQIKSLGSRILYHVNQGVVPYGKTASEQLAQKGISPKDIQAVIISHLDCDHANGLDQFKNAKRVLVSKQEYEYARKHRIRFYKKWWSDLDNIDFYQWNDTEGPFKQSYDVFGDKTVELINIPGHTAGQVATKITNPQTKQFVLYVGDGGYSEHSWKKMITSGISMNKDWQKKSLQWIKEQSQKTNCKGVFACHDNHLKPMSIEF